jgi:hypothetical protein
MPPQSVPLYSCDNELLDRISLASALRRERVGHARLVRTRKGIVARAHLLRRGTDPKASKVADYMGQRYSARQLEVGRGCWRLRPLQGGRSESLLAPDDMKPVFVAVLLECLT